MGAAVYAGLAVSSHAAGALSTVSFDNAVLSMNAGCNPLTFGAVGNGKTDNTVAIILQNSPMWTQAFRFSDQITETGVTVKALDTS
jgi:hypothetical protein